MEIEPTSTPCNNRILLVLTDGSSTQNIRLRVWVSLTLLSCSSARADLLPCFIATLSATLRFTRLLQLLCLRTLRTYRYAWAFWSGGRTPSSKVSKFISDGLWTFIGSALSAGWVIGFPPPYSVRFFRLKVTRFLIHYPLDGLGRFKVNCWLIESFFVVYGGDGATKLRVFRPLTLE